MVFAVIAGGIILFPSLAVLFRLTLRGKLPRQAAPGAASERRQSRGNGWSPALQARVAAACLLVGIGFLIVANTGWSHAIGIASLFGFIIVGFRAALPPHDFTDP